MRTRPLWIKYMASPASPARKSVVSEPTSWVRSRLRNSTAASLSSEANNGTDRIASSVISWGVGVDMGYLNKVAQTSVCDRSEEHTPELQSRLHLVCRLL